MVGSIDPGLKESYEDVIKMLDRMLIQDAMKNAEREGRLLGSAKSSLG